MKKNNAPPIEYNIVLSDSKQGVVIDWGNSPDWQEEYKYILDNAVTIGLVPKDDSQGRSIIVRLDEEKRWILFSRVFGQATSGRQVRFYAVGWQKSTGCGNIKEIIWLYPDGTIESGVETPTYWQLYFREE